MGQFLLLAQNVDVMPLAIDLHQAPDLWDQNPQRRTYPGTPHAAMTDITARYMPPERVTPEARGREHRNVFWPAWHRLPALRPLVFGLMARVSAVELGSIILTRLPPGAMIKPHSDAGSWGPEHYNCKAHLTVAGAAVTICAGEACRQQAGEVWTWDNLLTHSVENRGECDRIACIVSMRVE